MKLEVACKQAADMIYVTATFAARDETNPHEQGALLPYEITA